MLLGSEGQYPETDLPPQLLHFEVETQMPVAIPEQGPFTAARVTCWEMQENKVSMRRRAK